MQRMEVNDLVYYRERNVIISQMPVFSYAHTKFDEPYVFRDKESLINIHL